MKKRTFLVEADRVRETVYRVRALSPTVAACGIFEESKPEDPLDLEDRYNDVLSVSTLHTTQTRAYAEDDSRRRTPLVIKTAPASILAIYEDREDTGPEPVTVDSPMEVGEPEKADWLKTCPGGGIEIDTSKMETQEYRVALREHELVVYEVSADHAVEACEKGFRPRQAGVTELSVVRPRLGRRIEAIAFAFDDEDMSRPLWRAGRDAMGETGG